MNDPASELNRFLLLEKQEIEYWRDANVIRTDADFENEFVEKPFLAAAAAPSPPKVDAERTFVVHPTKAYLVS